MPGTGERDDYQSGRRDGQIDSDLAALREKLKPLDLTNPDSALSKRLAAIEAQQISQKSWTGAITLSAGGLGSIATLLAVFWGRIFPPQH